MILKHYSFQVKLKILFQLEYPLSKIHGQSFYLSISLYIYLYLYLKTHTHTHTHTHTQHSQFLLTTQTHLTERDNWELIAYSHQLFCVVGLYYEGPPTSLGMCLVLLKAQFHGVMTRTILSVQISRWLKA
jgi:hypothetical protein